MNRYRRIYQLTITALLLTGTAGLLLNELIYRWGRPATLLFAALSALGFALWIFVKRKYPSPQ